MKKLLRFILFVAVVAAVVWATRERMLPAPPPPDHHPPPFRRPPERAPEATPAEPAPPQPASPESADAPDDLQRVKGIGPVYEARLHDLGITSFGALIGADSNEVAEALEVQVAAVVDWKTQASEFVG